MRFLLLLLLPLCSCGSIRNGCLPRETALALSGAINGRSLNLNFKPGVFAAP